MNEVGRKSWLIRAMPFLALTAVLVGVFVWGETILSEVNSVLASSEEEPVPVREARRRDYLVTAPGTGEIIGQQSVPVQTPRTRAGGLTIAWLAPEGAYVEKGDVVVRFDRTEAELNKEKQETALEANRQETRIAEAAQELNDTSLALDLASAEADYEYSMSVLPEDETIFSEWEIIDAKLDAELAKKRIDALNSRRTAQKRISRSDQQILEIERGKAETELSIAEQTLEALVLTAPDRGIVTYRRDRGREPQVGDQTWPGQVLIELTDLARLQARIYVLERDAAGLSSGREVEVVLDSMPSETFRGTLSSVSTLAQPLDRTSPLRYFTCDATIDGIEELGDSVRPGMRLQAEVVLERYDSVFVVPASAVTSKEGTNLVYVQSGKEYSPRQVETAAGSVGQTVVLSGLNEGEMVALANPFERRKLRLPDFSKGGSTIDSGPRFIRRMRFR